MGLKTYAAVLLAALSPVILAAEILAAGPARAAAIDPAMGGPGNAAHGQTLFQQRCAICHQPDPGGKNGVGPALYGAYGRKAGQAAGFTYSDGVKASGIVWTPDKLNQWIQKPSSLVPGAKMALAPVSAPQDRADIIAYLATRSTAVIKAEAPAHAAAASKKKARKAAS